MSNKKLIKQGTELNAEWDKTIQTYKDLVVVAKTSKAFTKTQKSQLIKNAKETIKSMEKLKAANTKVLTKLKNEEA